MEEKEQTKKEKIVDLFDVDNNLNTIKKWVEENSKSAYLGDLMEFVDFINGNDADEGIIWHYTKMNVLEKILQKDRVNIRFTDTNDSSDPLEALIYKPFLIKNKEKILDNLKNDENLCKILKKDFEELIINKENVKKRITTYIFSLSRLKNSHAFWSKEYAGLDGISIGFNESVLKKAFNKNGNNVLDVLYIEPDKNIKSKDTALVKAFSRIIGDIYYRYNNLFNYLNSIDPRDYTVLSVISDIYSGFIKHKSWKYERETRITLADIKDVKLNSEKEFIGGKKRVHYETLNKDVISSIMLGPACNDEQVEAIREYLKNNGYDIPVERSHAFDLKYTDFERL